MDGVQRSSRSSSGSANDKRGGSTVKQVGQCRPGVYVVAATFLVLVHYTTRSASASQCRSGTVHRHISLGCQHRSSPSLAVACELKCTLLHSAVAQQQQVVCSTCMFHGVGRVVVVHSCGGSDALFL